MLTLSTNQQNAISFIYNFDESILVAETGEGKTVVCLTAIKELIDGGQHERFIVGVPAKVLERQVWSTEYQKWPHLDGLILTELVGDPDARRQSLLDHMRKHQVLVISLNNLEWLLKETDHGATGIVIDELSKASGKWTRALRSKKYGEKIVWRCGITASPVSQNLRKLFKMCRIIDGGEALGTNEDKFNIKYFYPNHDGNEWTIRDDGSAEAILDACGHLIHVMPDNKKEKLPPLNFHTLKFKMPKETRAIYDEMKVDLVVEYDEDLIEYIDSASPIDFEDEETIIDAANTAVNVGKLRQIASGFMYADRERKRLLRLDQERMLMAAEWWTALNGKRGLIFYEFVEQGKTLNSWTPSNVECFQIGAMSHGVEGLQFEYADLLFYQPIWSRDAWIQAYGRLWRQGQEHPVNVTTILCDDSVDQIVVARVEENAQWMEMLKEHLSK